MAKPFYSATVLRRYKVEALDEIAMLRGEPPHNVPWNICYGDGYFAMSMLRKYGVKDIAQLEAWAKS